MRVIRVSRNYDAYGCSKTKRDVVGGEPGYDVMIARMKMRPDGLNRTE